MKQSVLQKKTTGDRTWHFVQPKGLRSSGQTHFAPGSNLGRTIKMCAKRGMFTKFRYWLEDSK